MHWTTAAVAVLAVSGLLGIYFVAGDEIGERIDKAVEDAFPGLADSEILTGKPIEGELKGQYLTETFGNGVEIPLRAGPNQAKQVGIALGGSLVDALPVYGASYQSFDVVEGEFVTVGGRTYGRWYLVDVIPTFKKTDSGEYVSTGVARDVYVAGNFLTKPSEESDNSSNAR